MADIKPQFVRRAGDYMLYKWEGFKDDDTAIPLNVEGFRDITVYIDGAFDGNTVSIQGAPLDDNDWYRTLRDVGSGTAMSFTAGSHGTLLDMGLFMRPAKTAGSGTSQDVDVYLLGKRL